MVDILRGVHIKKRWQALSYVAVSHKLGKAMRGVWENHRHPHLSPSLPLSSGK
jgi:hypothetical protein